jgi:DNA-binding transcriptional ArsR family regulator
MPRVGPRGIALSVERACQASGAASVDRSRLVPARSSSSSTAVYPIVLGQRHVRNVGTGQFDSDPSRRNHRSMAMTAIPTTDRRADSVEPLDAASCLFQGFSDPSRLAILRHLSLGQHRVTDLTAHIGLAQSTVSKHLACLRDCGLVTSRPEGRASMFSLTHPEALDDLFAAAERLLALTGDAVALCANYGTDTLPKDAR